MVKHGGKLSGVGMLNSLQTAVSSNNIKMVEYVSNKISENRLSLNNFAIESVKCSLAKIRDCFIKQSMLDLMQKFILVKSAEDNFSCLNENYKFVHYEAIAKWLSCLNDNNVEMMITYGVSLENKDEI